MSISLYKVTNIVERTTITPEGLFQVFMEVHFETKSGVKSSILIKKEEFTKAKAEELVEKAAKEIESTMALKK